MPPHTPYPGKSPDVRHATSVRTVGEGGGSPTNRPDNRAIGGSRPLVGRVADVAGAADDGPVPAEPGANLAPEPPEARLTVAAVARRLGVAPATLRTWDRRYGLGPTLRSAGAHRRYSRSDIARLEAMRRLVLDGVSPADAARLAVDQVSRPATRDGPPPGPSGRLGPLDGVRPGGPGGRVLALPGGTAETRGLARAAMALDAASIRVAVERKVTEPRGDPGLDRAALPGAGRGRRAVGGHRGGRRGGAPAGRDRGQRAAGGRHRARTPQRTAGAAGLRAGGAAQPAAGGAGGGAGRAGHRRPAARGRAAAAGAAERRYAGPARRR